MPTRKVTEKQPDAEELVQEAEQEQPVEPALDVLEEEPGAPDSDESVQEPTAEEPPPDSLEAKALAAHVKAHLGQHKKEFEPERDIKLMHTYGGLYRVFPNNKHVHVASYEDLENMSAQQVYDAVKAAK
jgi:hypothetical protein